MGFSAEAAPSFKVVKQGRHIRSSLIGVILKQRENFYALLTSTSSDDIVMRNLISDMNPDYHTFVGPVPQKTYCV